MTKFKQQVVPTATLLTIIWLTWLLAPVIPAGAVIVKDLRTGNNDGFVRMVIEFDSPLKPPPALVIDRNRLQIFLTGIDNAFAGVREDIQHSGLNRIDISKAPGRTCIEAIFSFEPSDVKTFSLTGPHRFIIDAYRPLPPKTADAPVAASAGHQAETRSTALTERWHSAQKPLSASISSAIVGASLTKYGELASEGVISDRSPPDRFQQQLVVALIVVTTIIVILLFFLIWLSSGKGRDSSSIGSDQLPPTADPDIEAIDTAIRECLDSYDRAR